MKLVHAIPSIVAFLAIVAPLTKCLPTLPLEVGGIADSLAEAKVAMPSDGKEGCCFSSCKEDCNMWKIIFTHD